MYNPKVKESVEIGNKVYKEFTQKAKDGLLNPY